MPSPLRYRSRDLEPLIRAALRQFPAILLTGPRQTGKSTLLRHLFPRFTYLSFDLPAERARARQDPELFLETVGTPALFDEIQYVPELLPYLKIVMDRDRRARGMYVMTGSQVFPLMKGVTESLAGRTALFELLGFSMREIPVRPADPAACFRRIFRGSYPEPALGSVDPNRFYGSYLGTYLERDLRGLTAVHDLGRFHSFLELLAARSGSLLNLSEVARDCGINHQTGRNWLSILESTRLVYLLRPYSRNVTKRIVKSPKLYFTDTGLLAHLLRYPDPGSLAQGPLAGVFFETFLVGEALRHRAHRGINAEFYYHRDSNGNEIDLLIDRGPDLRAIEFKRGKTQHPAELAAFERNVAPLKPTGSFWVSLSDRSVELARGIRALPWTRFHEVWE